MSKKATGKHYTSKGVVGKNKKLLNQVRKQTSVVDMFLNKVRAHDKGKNVYVTIDNPNPHQTNKRKIRVKASEVFGSYKQRQEPLNIMKHV